MKVLAIIGPSGCGKTTILEYLFKEGLVYVNPTYTERPKREAEEVLEHKFVTSKEFDRLSETGFFVEVIQAFGLNYRYGVPYLKDEAGKIPLIMLRAQFLPLLLKHYPDNVIYQVESPVSLAERRIKMRGDKELGSRLEQFVKEVEAGRKYADRVFVNDKSLASCVDQIRQALKADFS